MEYLTELTVAKLNANTEEACIITKRPDHVAFSYNYVLRNATTIKVAISSAVKKLLKEIQGRGDDYFVDTFALTQSIGCAAAEFKAKNMTIETYDEDVYVYAVHCIYDTNGDYKDANYSSDDVCSKPNKPVRNDTKPSVNPNRVVSLGVTNVSNISLIFVVLFGLKLFFGKF